MKHRWLSACTLDAHAHKKISFQSFQCPRFVLHNQFDNQAGCTVTERKNATRTRQMRNIHENSFLMKSHLRNKRVHCLTFLDRTFHDGENSIAANRDEPGPRQRLLARDGRPTKRHRLNDLQNIPARLPQSRKSPLDPRQDSKLDSWTGRNNWPLQRSA